MNTRTCCGSMVNARQAHKPSGEGGPTPEMAPEVELIELMESDGDEVVDLTCESSEPTVIDLTHNDSVVITEKRRSRRNTRPLESQTDSCMVSSDEEESMRNRDVYVINSVHHNALPGYIWCRICMDGYSEIEQSRRRIYSTECGHIFCSQCLRNSLKYTKTCPVCLKKIYGHQYHRIYI
ncbi:E3 ubiquitin-protein ligase RNF4-like [Orycteropus afer afer]|uniref:E3 ubiquitin-protein ligase RNF4-like n=1 Tax=Orycteropus afer afer TaxID=1230840 RepID=A0AC54ZGQ5_ORYAF|nr:E3 ubiquitin-protein ligase RNF4-like [Orycteropus afer afer]